MNLIALLHASPVEHSHYETLAVAVLITVAIGISIALMGKLRDSR